MNKLFRNLGIILVALLIVSGFLTAREVLKQKNVQLIKEIAEQQKKLAEMKTQQLDRTPEDLFKLHDEVFQGVKKEVMQVRVVAKYPVFVKRHERIITDIIKLEGNIEKCRSEKNKFSCGSKLGDGVNEIRKLWIDFKNDVASIESYINKSKSDRDRATLDPFFYFCYNKSMHKKYLYYTLTFLTLAISLLAWYSVDRAIHVPDSSTWIMPTICFSFLFVFFLLDIILIQSRKWNSWLLGGALLSSILFSQSIWFFGFFVFALAFLIWGMVEVHEDIQERIKLNIRKSSASGAKWIILSLSLAIVGQYYLTLQGMDGEKIFPKFKMGEIASKISMKTVPYLLPQFETIRKPDATVDDFVNELTKFNQKNSNQFGDNNIDDFIESQIPADLSLEQKERVRSNVKMGLNGQEKNQQELILSEGRKQLADLSGKEILGSEKIQDVLPLIVEKKIENYFVPNVKSKGESRVILAFFSAAIFLTVYSIGIFLDWFLILFLAGILWALEKGGIISVKNIDAKQEYIEIQ